MIKTTITEVTEKFDKEGRVIERITRTEKTDDYTNYGFLDQQNILSNVNKEWNTTPVLKTTETAPVKKVFR